MTTAAPRKMQGNSPRALVRRGHDTRRLSLPMCADPNTLGERFWSKVQKTDGCWNWTRAKTWGYGSYRMPMPSGKWKTFLAHRLSYQEIVGPIPSDLVIDHLCRNRACVNPAHMELVTRGENVLRGESMAAQHARFGRCNHPNCRSCRGAESATCKRGHLFDENNTYIAKNGQRMCRKCSARRMRIHRGTARAGDLS